VLVADPAAPTAGHALTQDGDRQLFGLDIADGRIKVPTGAVLIRWDALEPHPDNPREAIGEQELSELADTIEAEAQKNGGSGVQQNLVVGITPNANGKLPIYIGERRWRAARKLVDEGRLPREVELPCVQRRDTPSLIFELSLVENGQRVDLKPLERAIAFHALHVKNNWQPPRIARETGYDLRTVQESIKVIKEATAENLALHRANPPKGDHTWEWLRDTVKVAKPKVSLDLKPAEALVLIEIYHAVLHQGVSLPPGSGALPKLATEILKPDSGGVWSALRDRQLILPIFHAGRIYAQTSPAVDLWAAEIGYAADNEGALFRLRAEVVGSLEASALEPGRYLTPFLNLPPAPEPGAAPEPSLGGEGSPTQANPDKPVAEEDAPGSIAIGFGSEGSPPPSDQPLDAAAGAQSMVEAYASLAGKALEGARPSAPVAPPTDPLDAKDVLVLVELAHAIQACPVSVPGRELVGAATHEVFGHPEAQKLVTKRVLGFANGPRGAWLAFLGPKGWEWLEAAGLSRKGQLTVTETALVEAQSAALGADKVEALAAAGVYATPWLNPVPPAEVPAATAAGASAARPKDDFSRQVEEVVRQAADEEAAPLTPEQEAEAEARLILDQVMDVGQWSEALFAGFLRAIGAPAPWSCNERGALFDAQCATVLQVDVERDRPDAAVETLALLVARAVNCAAGQEG
jgi:ParB/RepB/Spo0J family partition protein